MHERLEVLESGVVSVVAVHTTQAAGAGTRTSGGTAVNDVPVSDEARF